MRQKDVWNGCIVSKFLIEKSYRGLIVNIILYYFKKRCIRNRDLSKFGWLMVTRTQSFSMPQLQIEEGRTVLQN